MIPIMGGRLKGLLELKDGLGVASFDNPSYFELIFDGNDYYDLPFTLINGNDFFISFQFYLASKASTQVILDLQSGATDANIGLIIDTAGRFKLTAQGDDSSSISVQTSISATGSWYTISVFKSGNLYGIIKDSGAAVTDSLATTMNFSDFVSYTLSLSSGGILNGNKIRNWQGLWAWPGVNDSIFAYQDAAKTTLAANGVQVSAIETAQGDITQSTSGNMAKAVIPVT